MGVVGQSVHMDSFVRLTVAFDLYEQILLGSDGFLVLFQCQCGSYCDASVAILLTASFLFPSIIAAGF